MATDNPMSLETAIELTLISAEDNEKAAAFFDAPGMPSPSDDDRARQANLTVKAKAMRTVAEAARKMLDDGK